MLTKHVCEKVVQELGGVDQYAKIIADQLRFMPDGDTTKIDLLKWIARGLGWQLPPES